MFLALFLLFVCFRECSLMRYVQSDHVAIPVVWKVPMTELLTRLATSPLKGALELFKYNFFRTGLVSMPIQIISLLIRDSSFDDTTSDFVSGIPSIPSNTNNRISVLRSQEYLPAMKFMPLVTSAMDNLEELKFRFAKLGIFSLLTTLLRPKSRGTVRLRFSSPHDRPKVDFGIMRNPADFRLVRK